MTNRIIATLYPLSLLLAAALLIKGYSGVGDGFSAGATAGLGAALQYVCMPQAVARRRVGGRHALRMLTLGLLLALAPLLLPTLVDIAPVSHYPAPGAEVVELGDFKLHTSVIFDLAVALVVYGTLVATFDELFPPSTSPAP